MSMIPEIIDGDEFDDTLESKFFQILHEAPIPEYSDYPVMKRPAYTSHRVIQVAVQGGVVRGRNYSYPAHLDPALYQGISAC